VVVVLVGDRGDGADEVGIGDEIGVCEATVDGKVVEAFRVGRIGRIAAQPIGIGAGAVIGVGVGGAVLMNEPPVAAKFQGVLTFGPAEVVNNVVDRDPGDGGAGLRGLIGQEAEVDIISGAGAVRAVSRAEVAVANVIHQTVGEDPGIAENHAFGVVLED
jgi:hypothetical protein